MPVLDLLFLFSVLFIIYLVLRPVFTSKSQTLLTPSPFALPIIGHFHLIGPLIHRSFYNLSLRFGPLFSIRLGSIPGIVVSSPEIVKEFLETPRALLHIPHRKLIINGFLSNRSVSNFAPIRTQEYLRLLRLLTKKAESSEAVNLTEELPKLSNNVIAKMILGSSEGPSDEGRDEEARVVVREVTRIFGEFNLSDFVWFCKKTDLQGFGKRIEDTHRRYSALVEKVISEREDLRKKNMRNGGCSGGHEEEEVEEAKGFLDILLDLV
ncbi:hypothetical protein ACFX13_030200 [Malus domestica]